MIIIPNQERVVSPSQTVKAGVAVLRAIHSASLEPCSVSSGVLVLHQPRKSWRPARSSLLFLAGFLLFLITIQKKACPAISPLR